MEKLLENLDFWALMISLLALYISLKGFLSDRASVEIEIDAMIKDVNEKIRNIQLMLAEHEEDVREKLTERYGGKITDNELLEFLEQNDNIYLVKQDMKESIISDYINTYEEICSKYIDGKIDSRRFRKNYKSVIKTIYNDDEFKDRLNCEESDIVKVYKELFPE